MTSVLMFFVTITFITGFAGIVCLLFGAIGTGLGLLALAYVFFHIADAGKR